MAVEFGDRLARESALPGRQGRLAFPFLVLNCRRPVSRADIVSKLRAVLKRSGMTAADAAIDARATSFGLRLPLDTWVDVEAAANAIDEAEGALRAADPVKAWGCANVVVNICRRPFLLDHDAPWIETHRAAQRTLLTRGLQCLAGASQARGHFGLAIRYATEVLDLEPFRETEYRRLMQVHAAMGNRAEALRVFERCRHLLREELGATPSQETEAVFLVILSAGS